MLLVLKWDRKCVTSMVKNCTYCSMGKMEKRKTSTGANDEDDDARLDHDGGFGTVELGLGHTWKPSSSHQHWRNDCVPDGRIGDTAIIGAGTWADDRVAVSCTGVEVFIRTLQHMKWLPKLIGSRFGRCMLQYVGNGRPAWWARRSHC